MSNIRIVEAREEDEDIVFESLINNFFVDEPLNFSLKRTPIKNKLKLMKHVASGYSYIAYDVGDDGEKCIAGLVINKIERKGEEHDSPPQEPDSLKIYNILNKLDRMLDIWTRVKSDRVLYTIILSVDKNYRRLNIGKRLMEASLKKATASGLTHAVVECSSFYSSKIVQGLGYERLCEIRYDEYKDENGERIFNIQEPHKEIVKFLKTLPIPAEVLISDDGIVINTVIGKPEAL